MKKILETQRLMLREFSLEDAAKLWELNADPEVIRYTGDGPFASVEAAGEFLSGYRDYRTNGFGRWAVISRASNEFLGWSGLKLNEEGLVDIGFRFFKREWNKGYATESARACLEYGFNELEIAEIVGRAAKANIASIRVLEKLDMKFWKEAPCLGISEAVYYKLRKSDYK